MSKKTSQDSLKGEKWKDLNPRKYPALKGYAVSSEGRIKSFKYNKEGLILKGSVSEGYPVLSVRNNDGEARTYFIHRLVADMFLLPPKKSQTRLIHLDYTKANNKASNLKWVDTEGFSKHQSKNPVYLNREKPGNSKLTIAKVRQLKKMIDDGKQPLYKIAAKFGISHTQLNRIRNGENWSNV